MKNRFFAILCSAVAVVTLSVVSLALHSADSTEISGTQTPNSGKLITVAEAKSVSPDAEKVLEARFLNMLNHSYAYNEDFDTVEALVNQSVIALLDMRDTEDESYISQDIVADYIFNMYGIKSCDFSAVNTEFPQREGFVYIVPRGYSQVTHTAKAVTENEDGSFTFKTVAEISSHDGETYYDTCETLFVKNEASSFGFSIISSVIGSEAAEAQL